MTNNNANRTSGHKNGTGNTNHHFHLPREDAYVTAGNAQIKISTVPKEIPIFTYSIGHQRTDHETGKAFFAPYVRHQDMPAVIASLQAEYARNESAIAEVKSRIGEEYREGELDANSWKKDKGSKELRRLHREGTRAVKGEDMKPKVDSAKQREKNLQTFHGVSKSDNGEGPISS